MRALRGDQPAILVASGLWVEGQIGLEPTFDQYLTTMTEVFTEVRRVLRPDGTLWLNLGDVFSDRGKPLPPKNLIGLPWRVAFALQEAGWILRSDIVWFKLAPMPESIRDRPTRSHEYVFLMTKRQRYFYDADAVRTPVRESTLQRLAQDTFWQQQGGEKDYGPGANRSARKVTENQRRKHEGGPMCGADIGMTGAAKMAAYVATGTPGSSRGTICRRPSRPPAVPTFVTSGPSARSRSVASISRRFPSDWSRSR